MSDYWQSDAQAKLEEQRAQKEKEKRPIILNWQGIDMESRVATGKPGSSTVMAQSDALETMKRRLRD